LTLSMRLVRYSVATSLDGYIGGPKGEFDWIPMDPDIDFGALFKRYDTRLMGRKSWDEAQKVGGGGGGGGMSKMPTYVFSKTLRQADCRDAVVSADPKAVVTDLKKKKGKDIWLFGGGELFRSLLALGLVDEVEVGLVPVILGRGLPMLPSPAEFAKLKLTSHRVYEKTGTVLLRYAVR
jgi:dihydrofolate reductase